jgi:anti-repressor protein
MAAEITPFAFPATGQPVRTVTVDGQPWFVGRDVALALGYSNPRDALAKHVPAHHKGMSRIATPSGDQDVTVISEAGMYRLIMRSNAELAERFQEWVTAEVLPAIRRTGSYGLAIPDMATPAGRMQILDMAMAAERRALAAEEKVAELEPEAARARRTMDTDGMVLIGTVAKRFGIKERALREFLFAEKLLIRDGARRNEPYARHIPIYFDVKTRLVDVNPDRAPEQRSTTYVTPRGEVLIWRRLFAVGLVSSPIMPGVQLAIEGGA